MATGPQGRLSDNWQHLRCCISQTPNEIKYPPLLVDGVVLAVQVLHRRPVPRDHDHLHAGVRVHQPAQTAADVHGLFVLKLLHSELSLLRRSVQDPLHHLQIELFCLVCQVVLHLYHSVELLHLFCV